MFVNRNKLKFDGLSAVEENTRINSDTLNNSPVLKYGGIIIAWLGVVEMILNKMTYSYAIKEAKKQIQNSSYNTIISKFKFYNISERYNSNWTDFAIKEEQIKPIYNLKKNIIFTTEDLKNKILIPCAYYKNDKNEIADVIFYKK